MRWQNNLSLLQDNLVGLQVTDYQGLSIDPDEAFEMLEERTIQLRDQKRTMYLIGNGASSSMASHVSADLAKNAMLHTQVFTDLALITALANDIAYDSVFSEPIARRMNAGDILVAISSSGQSPNILKAVDQAHQKAGFVITLSAMNQLNSLRSKGHLNFYVPAKTYGMAETSHNAILHHWIDIITGDA